MSRTSKITSSPAHRQAQLDAAVEPAAERAAHPGLRREATASAERNRHTRTTDTRAAHALHAVDDSRRHDGDTNRSERIGFCHALHAVDDSRRHDGDTNRSERIGFWIYVAMGILCAAVLVAAAISAIVS